MTIDIDKAQRYIQKNETTYLSLGILFASTLAVYCQAFKLLAINIASTNIPSGIIVASEIFLICFWMDKRRLKIFDGEKIGILLATSSDRGLEEDLRKIECEFANKINENNLNCLIEVRKLPQNISVDNITKAFAIREKSNATLMLWGGFEEIVIFGEKLKAFPDGKLHFTFKSFVGDETATCAYNDDIGCGVGNRQWHIAKDDYIDKQMLVNNMSQVSLYLIGISLLYCGYADKASQVLELAVKNISGAWKKDVSGKQSEMLFITKVKHRLAIAYHNLAYLAYKNKVFDGATFDLNHELIGVCDKYLQKSLQNKPLADAYLLLAIGVRPFG